MAGGRGQHTVEPSTLFDGRSTCACVQVDEGETFEAAALRELREETAMVVPVSTRGVKLVLMLSRSRSPMLLATAPAMLVCGGARTSVASHRGGVGVHAAPGGQPGRLVPVLTGTTRYDGRRYYVLPLTDKVGHVRVVAGIKDQRCELVPVGHVVWPLLCACAHVRAHVRADVRAHAQDSVASDKGVAASDGRTTFRLGAAHTRGVVGGHHTQP